MVSRRGVSSTSRLVCIGTCDCVTRGWRGVPAPRVVTRSTGAVSGGHRGCLANSGSGNSLRRGLTGCGRNAVRRLRGHLGGKSGLEDRRQTSRGEAFFAGSYGSRFFEGPLFGVATPTAGEIASSADRACAAHADTARTRGLLTRRRVRRPFVEVCPRFPYTVLPGQILHRYLDLKQNSVIRFNLIRSSAPTDFMLVAPDERTQVFSTQVSSGPIRAPVSGVCSFQADPENSVRAEFEASFGLDSAAVSPEDLTIHE